MNAPFIERRELTPRLEVQLRVVGGDSGAPMRLPRSFRLTERGLGELVAHAGRLEAVALAKTKAGFSITRLKKRSVHEHRGASG